MRRVSKTTTTLAAAITFALAGTAAPALAQDSDDEQRANPLMEEVVVTARKMEETIQDVPVAVSAVSAAMIEDLQLNSLEDISKITAGLVFDSEFQRGSNRLHGLRRRSEGILVRSELDGALDPELALELLDRLAGLVGFELGDVGLDESSQRHG